MKTLLRPGRLGDVVLLGSVTSALGACRVATEARYHPVATRLDGVVAVIEPHDVERKGLVDLQGSVSTRLRFPGVPRIRKHSVRRRLGLGRGGFVRPTVPELYARAAGVDPAPLPWIRLPEAPRDTLVLVPGAAWGPKRPAADILVAAHGSWNGRTVVLGGPGEERLCADLAGRLGVEAVVESGFDRTFEVLSRAALTVAGDTGLLHLAGASGSPVVAFFGPTHPADGFMVYPGIVVQKALACRPCALHRVEVCALGHRSCGEDLDDRVRQFVASLSRATPVPMLGG